ncbi:unnamed protein product [Auanema sp. JU1783]|nr:unnamed protein product [Auanema sp. JU1783]
MTKKEDEKIPRAGKQLVRSRALGRYRLPESIYAEKEEGYDGHLQWDPTSKKTLVMMQQFREAVKYDDLTLIVETLDSLGAAGTEAQILHIADLILNKSAEPLKEALLCAICIGSRPLTEFILCLFDDFAFSERTACTESSAFPPHMTPLLLACIMNNFAIVECLLLRGHTISPPHHNNCGCLHCLRMPHSALASMQKVDILRALSSEAYLWLATDDPFAAACALASDLQQFIRDDNLEYMDWYRSLLQNVQRFAARLVDQAWSEHELDLFLSHRDYSPLLLCEDPYPRVQMALDSEMREMVSSTNVQRAMEEIWWRGWGSYGSSPKRDSYRNFRHFICYPILALLYIISNGKMVQSFEVPLARFISNLSSYFGFVACLIIVRLLRNNYVQFPFNSAIATTLEFYIFLYVAGMLVERYILFSRHGLRNYFRFWWRWFDFMLIGVFLLSIHLWITIFFVSDSFLMNTHRIHWTWYDEHLLYEIYFGTGCVLAIWKIFYFFQLRKGLGGSIISVGKCVSTVYNYLVIMAVIMLSFAVGINIIVQPYLNNIDNTNGMQRSTSPHFTDIVSSYRNLYWSFYGYLDPQFYQIIVGNMGDDNEASSHVITNFSIEILMAVYHVIVIITLLNLMISLLVKKADEVLENEEMEFKYIRVVVYSEYIHWTSAVPPPFNLLYIAKELICRLFDEKYRRSWPDFLVDSNIVQPSSDECDQEHSAYRNLLLKSFQRYRSSKECHYKTVFRTEFDAKDKPTQCVPKVAFMNGPPTRVEVDAGITLNTTPTPFTDENNNIAVPTKRRKDSTIRKK